MNFELNFGRSLWERLRTNRGLNGEWWKLVPVRGGKGKGWRERGVSGGSTRDSMLARLVASGEKASLGITRPVTRVFRGIIV